MTDHVLPTALIGFVQGPVRWESLDGDVALDGINSFLIFQEPQKIFSAQPEMCVSHIQKFSKFGFLLMRHAAWWQLCFHIWFTFRYQTRQGDKWVPGSESVLYWRVGWSRWQANEFQPYVGGYRISLWKWNIYIPFGTWYGPGLHWD